MITQSGSIVAGATEARVATHRWAPTLGRLWQRALTVWAIPVVLSLVTLIAFSPVVWNGFVEWDDQINITENLGYRGLGLVQFKYFFTTLLMGHWIPITWMTFGLDYVLWGMNPLGYHLTNLIVYAASAAALYFMTLLVLRKATTLHGAALRIGAIAGTLFFTLHPLRAESVAWVTERRDVLSGLFFFLTITAYLKMSDARGRRRAWLLAGALGLYILALTSKASVMVLPAVLILLDVYPLRRFDRWTLLEKIPFAVLGVAGAAVTYYAQNANRFITPLERYPLSARVGMTFYGLWFYVEKTVFPLKLSPLYELPAKVHPLAWRFLLPAVAVSIIGVTLVALRRRWPAGLATGMYYAFTLGPVIGIVHSGHQLTHDRYSYLPGVGLAVLVGGLVGVLARQIAAGAFNPRIGQALTATGVLLAAGLATLSFQQVQIWRDTDSLWRYALESEPSCSICHENMGLYLGGHGLLEQAREHFERSLALRPDQANAHNLLGWTHAFKGEPKEAAAAFETYLKRRPNDAIALANLASVLMTLQRSQEALTLMQRAEKLRPNSPFVLMNLGYALGETGHKDEALRYFRRAISIKWDMPQPWFGFARFSNETGRHSAALSALGILQMLSPELARRIGPTLLETW